MVSALLIPSPLSLEGVGGMAREIRVEASLNGVIEDRPEVTALTTSLSTYSSVFSELEPP